MTVSRTCPTQYQWVEGDIMLHSEYFQASFSSTFAVQVLVDVRKLRQDPFLLSRVYLLPYLYSSHCIFSICKVVHISLNFIRIKHISSKIKRLLLFLNDLLVLYPVFSLTQINLILKTLHVYYCLKR